MTANPIDTEALRNAVSGHGPDDHGPGICDQYGCFTSCVECDEDWPCLWSSLPDALAAAEHRATRAEARAKAALAVLDKAHDEFEQPDEADIRRALTA